MKKNFIIMLVNRLGAPLAIAAAALVTTNSPAQSINLSIETANPSPAAALEGPAGGLGQTWNTLGTNSDSGLLDSSGTATSVGYSNTNLGGPDQWGEPALGVLWSGLRNFDTGAENTQQFVINGLTVGELYDVWLVSANVSSGQRSSGVWSTPNNTITVGDQVVTNIAGINGDTWVVGNNYVIFENVEADANGELIFNGYSDHKDSVAAGGTGAPGSSIYDPRLPLNGFQLRPNQAADEVDPDTSKVVASPTAVDADGTSTSTITITLKDAIGLSIEGKDVTLANTSGPQMAVIDPLTAQTTDASGEATFTVSSSTIGVEEFTATDVTDGNLVITQTASVEFLEVVVIGPVDAAVSTVEASPSRIVADGSSSSTITVTLKDEDENPVAGKEVTLANTAGPGTPAIDPVGAQTTDANGEATFAVSSSTIGVEVFTATDVTDGNLVITQTASVDFLDPDAPLAIHVSISGPGKAPEAESSLVGPAGGMNSAWNQFENSSTSTLKASTGASTTIEYTTNYGIGTNEEPLPGLTMLIGGVTQFAKGVDDGANGTLTITGLDAGLYDIWLTSYREKGGGEYFKGDWTTANTTSTAGAQSIDNLGQGAGNGDTWVSGVNFVLFEGVEVDGSGTAVFNSTAAAAHRHGLNGFQLQEAAPGTAFAITVFDYSPETDEITLTWTSIPGETYAVKFSGDMTNWESDLDDGIPASAGETTTETFDLSDASLEDAERVYFRVERQDN